MLARLEVYRASALRDMTVGRKKLPDRCLPQANDGAWGPCFGDPPSVAE